jgi:dihydroneopterin aldolase
MPPLQPNNTPTTMDIIFLRELKIDTLIGVYEWEKRVPQTLQIDLEIALPSSLACQTDNIDDALNYADVVRDIQKALASRHYNLLEALAESIAQILIEDFKAPWVKVSVAKLQAIRGSRMVGISIERGSRV